MKLLDQVRDAAARRHLAQAAIECYLMWIVHFLQFCKQGDRWRATTSGRCRRCWATRASKTTMIYTHVMNKPAVAVVSPLDQMVQWA